MSEEKQMYFEEYKIKNVTDGVEGVKRVRLEIPDKNDLIIDVPEWELVATMTDEPSDATETRNKRVNIIVDKIYDLLKEHDVKAEDIGFMQQKLVGKLSGIEEKAINEKFGVENKYDIRIKHWDE